MIYYHPNEGVASVSAFQVNILAAFAVWLELNCETHVLRELTWTPSFFVVKYDSCSHTFLFLWGNDV